MFSFSNHSWQFSLKPRPLFEFWRNFRSKSNSCSGISSSSLSSMFQSHEYGSWALGGEECGDDCLEELFGLFWVDLSEETGVDFGVSGIVLGLAAGFLSGLSGVLSGVLGEDGVVTDGVDGGALRGAFLRRVFGFPFGS